MINRIFVAFCFAAITAATANSQGPTRTRDLLISYGDLRAGSCSTVDPAVGLVGANTPAGALLYNRTFRGQPDPDFCHPLLNPDGSQMTLGQYVAPSGRASVDCQRKGT